MVAYFRNIAEAIWSVLVGMKVTARHLFVPAITLQYPEQKLYPEKMRAAPPLPILYGWKPPDRYRGDLFCNIKDCIGCNMCVTACPVDCIEIVTERPAAGQDLGKTSKGQPIRLKLMRFDIDMTKCIFCGLCVDPCPTECLIMTTNYEFASYERITLVHHFAKPDEMYGKNSGGSGTPASGAPPAA